MPEEITIATGASSAHVGPQVDLLQSFPLKVVKRDGTSIQGFDRERINTAITKAMIATFKGQNGSTETLPDTIKIKAQAYTEAAVARIIARHVGFDQPNSVDVETIQNYVVEVLMLAGEQDVMTNYIIYRAQQAEVREQEKAKAPVDEKTVKVLMPDGQTAALTERQVLDNIVQVCKGIDTAKPQTMAEDVFRGLYDNIPHDEYLKSLTLAARHLIEVEPAHSYVAARMQARYLKRMAAQELGLTVTDHHLTTSGEYAAFLKAFVAHGIKQDMLNEQLAEYDLDRLAKAICPDRDELFTYLSMQTLFDRYFIHRDDQRYEMPQVFFMRVAMGLALEEKGDREARVIEFYNTLSTMRAMSSTPTLFNAGTKNPQLSSCFLTTVPDDLHGIFGAIQDNAMLSKFAGGLGNDWTNVRGTGSYIKGTNGKSLGVVPFLNVADATAIAVNQGGKRKGAVCAYLEAWHTDYEDFLELRKNTGDDRRRTHDMNTAAWIPDLLMKRVYEKGEWTLFSPNDVSDLHDLYGEAFEKRYAEYEAMAESGEIYGRKVGAVSLWRKHLSMLFETGHPWITMKDACNLRSPQQHAGVIHSSNLCTEITLNTSKEEVAVCNLASINIAWHVNEQGIDVEKLKQTVKTAVRMLDNVIDINFYAIPQAENSNMQHRPVGLGMMGFHDALYKQKIPYASDDAVEFADTAMELISYYAIEASSELAKERGSYATYQGSLWDQGILPIDSIELLAQSRGERYLDQNRDQRLDWATLREKVKEQGMRNSNVMAIAPTATISNICGVSQSIEPTYQNLYVKSNLSGEFTVVNPYLVAELKALGLWDMAMVNDLKYYDGSVQQIDRIPDDVKRLYATAFEIEADWLINAASRRQKWIDQAQSLNLYIANPSGKKLDKMYRLAFMKGLKTTYYLRSMGATSPEKSTLEEGKLNAVKPVKACSIDDPECEACQ